MTQIIIVNKLEIFHRQIQIYDNSKHCLLSSPLFIIYTSQVSMDNGMIRGSSLRLAGMRQQL